MNSVDMQCVRAGIELLDRVKPEWRSLVDRDTLDMLNPRKCIAGQVFANEVRPEGEVDGYTYLILHVLPHARINIDYDYGYGFYIHPKGSNYINLRDAWIELAGL